MARPSKDETYSEQETARRRDETARVLLKTPPRPNWWPTNVRKKRKHARKARKRPKH